MRERERERERGIEGTSQLPWSSQAVAVRAVWMEVALGMARSILEVPCSDSEGANGSGIYCLQLPSGAEAQYKLDATGTIF